MGQIALGDAVMVLDHQDAGSDSPGTRLESLLDYYDADGTVVFLEWGILMRAATGTSAERIEWGLRVFKDDATLSLLRWGKPARQGWNRKHS